MNEKISIIIVHRDEPGYLNLLIQSINICSADNDYEIIIVDNKSTTPKAMQYLQDLEDNHDNMNVIKQDDNYNYTNSILKGYEYVSKDSTYLMFLHSDHVVLSPEWLDFLVGLEIDNPKCGAACLGPSMSYTGPNNEERNGPYYNFLFTKKNIFEDIGKFQYMNCQNVGLFLGYQYSLQKIGMEVIMINPHGFIYHYNLRKVTEESKLDDIKVFNSSFVQNIQKK